MVDLLPPIRIALVLAIIQTVTFMANGVSLNTRMVTMAIIVQLHSIHLHRHIRLQQIDLIARVVLAQVVIGDQLKAMGQVNAKMVVHM